MFDLFNNNFDNNNSIVLLGAPCIFKVKILWLTIRSKYLFILYMFFSFPKLPLSFKFSSSLFELHLTTKQKNE